MNRKDLVEELSERFEGNREVAAQALDSVVDVITKSISAGEKVVISGFGEFQRKARDAGARAGEYVPEFKPGKELREAVSGSREWRDRVSSSLAVVPAAAAGTLRSVAEKARELATELASLGGGERTAGSAGARSGQAAKKAPAKKAPAKKASAAKKSTAPESSTAKKTAGKKTSPAKKSPAKKAPAKKTAAKKTTVKKASTSQPASKSAAKKA